MFNPKSPLHPHIQSNQIRLAKPLCIIVFILIICNLVTLYFLNKSVQRTSSMDCNTVSDSNMNNMHVPDQHIISKYNFHNLLPSDSPYKHLPYLPHNLKDFIHTNPNSINDPKFIETIKKSNKQRPNTDEQE